MEKQPSIMNYSGAKKTVFFLTLVFVICLCSQGLALNPGWKDQILYFVLIDRFHDGNPANNTRIDRLNYRGFHGGDISGITQKLDYLKELGVTGLWISPFIKNRDEPFYGQEAYHGYWPYDFFAVDERFGTMQELEHMRQALRKERFLLVLDMVVNHVGYDAPFEELHPAWFNKEGNIVNWDDEKELVNNRLFGLPDFASDQLIVKAFFRQVAQHWIRTLNPDGFRLDAVKHVPMEFWQDFNGAVKKRSFKRNFMLLGEYLDGNPFKLKKTWEEGGFDTLFDFPLYYSSKEVFGQGKSFANLASRLYFDRHYSDPGFLATFLDNHDVDRFITSCEGDLDTYKLAMAFLMTNRGIPVLCYGDEVPLEGAHGRIPTNRASMKFDTQGDIFVYTKGLIELRKRSEALRRGYQRVLYSSEDLFLFARYTLNQMALIAMNKSDRAQRLETPIPYKLKKAVIRPISGSDIGAQYLEERLIVSLPAKSFAVFVPEVEDLAGVYEEHQRWLEDETVRGMVRQRIRLRVNRLPDFAQVYVTGNCNELGSWDSKGCALRMGKVSDGVYEVSVLLPKGRVFECKSFFKTGDQKVWQDGDNYVHTAGAEGAEYLHMEWRR